MADHSHAPQVQPLDQAAAAHHDDHGHEHEEHAHDDHGGLMKYLYVFIALCLLTAMSFATFSDAWRAMFSSNATRAFMMAVSSIKAMLVILFFMHIKYEANWKYVLTIPAGMMSIFLILMLVPDVGMRSRWQSDESRAAMAVEADKRDNVLKPAPKLGH